MQENMSQESYDEYRKRKSEIIYNKIITDCNISDYLKTSFSPDEELVKLFDYMVDIKDEVNQLAYSIITNEERQYLINIIEPFSNTIEYIMKRKLVDGKADIDICYKDYKGYDQDIILPSFNIDDRYIYMELNRKYSLSELGILFKEEDLISIDITDNTNKLVEEEPIKKDIIPSNNDKDTTVTYTVSKIKLSELDKSYLDPLYTSVIIDCGKERTHINYITKSDNKVSIWYYSPKSGMDMKSININGDYDFLNMENNKLYKPEEIDFEF